jgi:enamine deaminase RidA (YjgF/YER057c/UK114 family)
MDIESRGSVVLALLLLGAWSSRSAQAGEFPVTRIPAPGGEVVFANPGEREEMYDNLHYAAARRAGDFVFLSGVEAGPFEKGDGNDINAFKIQLRRAFQAIKASLAASGADFSQVVRFESFHNCRNKRNFNGDFQAQLEAMIAVKAEFMKPPYSTWNAFCIDRHYSKQTVVEIVVEAYAPMGKK